MKSCTYDGKPRNVYPSICKQCGETFHVPKHRLNKAGFCSKKCCGAFKSSKTSVEVTCAQCGTVSRRKQSNTKSKSGLFFCNRACKELAQRIGGLASIQPSHYGTGISSYRDVAFRRKESQCELCGYTEVREVLVVHHKDIDRTNNQPDNLQILCPTCHAIAHFKSQTGLWWKR